ncbi:hypothetical protein EYF80_045507 [Liparis tanakae]|uniref:Uncharacterized protein n=1 Tax=Liparis tanakae TaxID=230148 RepID=A0A4Z2FVC2_9TELE|nr:hypothetical protein EYF80_045507 [Liparis tanakae]
MTLVPLQQQPVCDVFLSALEALLAHLMCSRDDKRIPHFYSFKSWSDGETERCEQPQHHVCLLDSSSVKVVFSSSSSPTMFDMFTVNVVEGR